MRGDIVYLDKNTFIIFIKPLVEYNSYALAVTHNHFDIVNNPLTSISLL